MVGRPRKYFTEEERKHANQQSKNKYILNKSGDVLYVTIMITKWLENGNI